MSDTNIGQIFIQARQEKNLTLEQVSEAIHVKIEYLEAIENGTFDVKLPDIYKRGFMKLYAEYLRLDADQVMKLCPVPKFETLSSTQKRRDMTMNIIKKSQAAEKMQLDPSIQIQPEECQEDAQSTTSRWMSWSEIKNNPHATNALKYTLFFLCFVVSIAIVYKLLFSKHVSPEQDAISTNLIHESSAVHTNINKQFTLHASGNVRIMVRTKSSKDKLFSGVIDAHTSKSIEYSEPVQLFFDHGEHFTITLHNGEILHPDTGRGGMEIN